MSTKILDGRELVGFIKTRQAQLARQVNPHLLIIRDSQNPVINTYVRLKLRYGTDIGAKVKDFVASSPSEIATKIRSANDDPNIHGIILQLPLAQSPDATTTDDLCGLIAPAKDVDGLGPNSPYDSATATAIMWLLAGYDIPLTGRKIAIIGRGKLVGAPLFRLMQASKLDVTLFHRGSDLTKLKQCAIIISATGVPGLVASDFVAPGTVLVDAGTASEKGVIRGDLALELYDRTDLAAITPVRGGVGPLTVACLFEHLLQATSRAQA